MVVKKLPKKISKFIKDKYYGDKPVVKLGKPLGFPIHTFKTTTIEADVPKAKEARKAFDNITYPIKVIIPKNKVKAYGVSEMVFKEYKMVQAGTRWKL